MPQTVADKMITKQKCKKGENNVQNARGGHKG